MKIIKYYCDICKQEVENEEKLLDMPCLPSKWASLVGEENNIIYMEICNNCLEDISNYMHDKRKKNK